MKVRVLMAAIAICYLPQAAQAAIVDGYGAYASASTHGNCPSFCRGGGEYHDDGGEFSPSASAMESTFGSGQAYASLSGSTFLPTLKVKASSDLGRGGFANAFGVQGYSYSGSATTVTLDFNLHGSVGDNAPGYVNNSLRADVAVIIGSELGWYPSYATLVYEVAMGLSVVGDESVFISNGIDQNAPGSITFDLEDGMDFYVVASMGATAKNGYANGWDTLTMDFDNASGLTAVSAIPVPAAVWLFGSGLLGLVGIARRRK